MKEKVFSSWWTGSDACAPASYLRARAAGRRRRNARRIARAVCAAPDDEGVHHSERARPRDHLRVACRQHREESLLQLLVEPRAQRGHAAHGDVRRRRLHVAVGGPPAVRRRVRLGRLDRRPALVGRQQRPVAREHGAALLDRRARPVDGAVGLVPRVHDLDGRRVRLEVGPGVRQPVRRSGVAVVVRAAVAAERERRRAEREVGVGQEGHHRGGSDAALLIRAWRRADGRSKTRENLHVRLYLQRPAASATFAASMAQSVARWSHNPQNLRICHPEVASSSLAWSNFFTFFVNL